MFGEYETREQKVERWAMLGGTLTIATGIHLLLIAAVVLLPLLLLLPPPRFTPRLVAILYLPPKPVEPPKNVAVPIRPANETEKPLSKLEPLAPSAVQVSPTALILPVPPPKDSANSEGSDPFEFREDGADGQGSLFWNALSGCNGNLAFVKRDAYDAYLIEVDRNRGTNQKAELNATWFFRAPVRLDGPVERNSDVSAFFKLHVDFADHDSRIRQFLDKLPESTDERDDLLVLLAFPWSTYDRLWTEIAQSPVGKQAFPEDNLTKEKVRKVSLQWPSVEGTGCTVTVREVVPKVRS